jgi:hypothetical protein
MNALAGNGKRDNEGAALSSAWPKKPPCHYVRQISPSLPLACANGFFSAKAKNPLRRDCYETLEVDSMI